MKKSDNNFTDFYDSSIFLGLLIEKDDACKERINLIGYKGRNKGVISHPVLAEITANLFLKINDSELRMEAFRLLETIFDRCLKQGILKISKIEKGEDFHVDDLMEKLQIEYSDARILSEAIVIGCKIFWTTDEYLNKANVKPIIKKEYGLIIKKP